MSKIYDDRCLIEETLYGTTVAVAVPETESERKARYENMKREFELKQSNRKRYYP